MDSILDNKESLPLRGQDGPRGLWPWSAAGGVIGLLTALVLLRFGAAGGEAAEGIVYLTFVGTQPWSSFLTPIMAPRTWWIFVVLSWCLQSSTIGVGVGATARFFRWSRLASGLVLLAVEVAVPWALLMLFSLRAR